MTRGGGGGGESKMTGSYIQPSIATLYVLSNITVDWNL